MKKMNINESIRKEVMNMPKIGGATSPQRPEISENEKNIRDAIKMLANKPKLVPMQKALRFSLEYLLNIEQSFQLIAADMANVTKLLGEHDNRLDALDKEPVIDEELEKIKEAIVPLMKRKKKTIVLEKN